MQQIRQKLIDLREEIHALEDTFKKTSKPVELDQSCVGRLSRIDAIQSQQMALEASRRHQHRLLKIEGALRRIKSGDYGYCFVCGEKIQTRRLSFDPTITRCMECVEK